MIMLHFVALVKLPHCPLIYCGTIQCAAHDDDDTDGEDDDDEVIMLRFGGSIFTD